MLLEIQKGDIVDIVFPATGCSENEVLSIKNYVKNELNLTPRILLEEDLILAPQNPENEFPVNSKKQRFLQLQEALKSKDSKIIWCARGGYGSGDLLPFLEKMNPIKQDKLFIGFSDIVSISSFFQDRWGYNIICAPVLVQLAREEIDEIPKNELKELIFGKKLEFSYDLEILNHPDSSETPVDLQIFSKVSGGCLSVLAGHFGTNYQINFHEKILFLEDEGEDGERLDRYLRQIIEVIAKEQKLPKAILLGNFLQSNPHGTPRAKNIQIAIDDFVKRVVDLGLLIPIFKAKDNDLGHSHKMRPLVLGVESKIVKHVGEFKLLTSL